ncbi:MAG: hypothetical protein GX637_06715 [Clostridiales bacterium]|nr:hypothetical protein [Clostridiales bacterium]
MSQSNRDSYEQRKEWERLEKEDHYRMAAGMTEFLGVVLGIVVILVLLALLFSLLNWLGQDFAGTFSILRTRFR